MVALSKVANNGQPEPMPRHLLVQSPAAGAELAAFLGRYARPVIVDLQNTLIGLLAQAHPNAAACPFAGVIGEVGCPVAR